MRAEVASKIARLAALVIAIFVLSNAALATTCGGRGSIYVLTYTWPYTGPGTEPFYMLRFDAGATGNAVPSVAQL